MPKDGAKAEHFSCFHSSCQLGLNTKKGNVYNMEGFFTLICNEIKIVFQELLQLIVTKVRYSS